jgi:hypothetical protein
MTEQEWALFAVEVEATFRGDLAEDREAALRTHFGRVTFEDGRAAVAALVERGQVFMPTPAELLQGLHAISSGEWDYRRRRAGHSVVDQQALDHVALCRATGQEPDADVLEQLRHRRLIEAGS